MNFALFRERILKWIEDDRERKKNKNNNLIPFENYEKKNNKRLQKARKWFLLVSAENRS